MPWEYIISAATKKYRARRNRVVVRRLVVADVKSSATTRTVAPKSFAILRAAPGKIGNNYDFGEEERLVARSNRLSDSMTVLTNTLRIDPQRIYDFGTTSTVHHTNYFLQPKTVDHIRKILEF